MMHAGRKHHVSFNGVSYELRLATWTSLAALAHWLHGLLAWVLAGTRDAFAVLEAIGTGAQDAFQDLPQHWMPHVSVRVGLAIVQTC